MRNRCSQTCRISVMVALAAVFLDAHAASDIDQASVTEPTAAEKRLAAYHQAFEATGETQHCINTRMIRHTKIIDKEHILFRLSHGRYALNKLPSTCHSLRKGRTFAYSPESMRLCSVDTITVFDSNSLHGSSSGLGRRNNHRGLFLNGPRCGLGQFSIVKKRRDLPTLRPLPTKELVEVPARR